MAAREKSRISDSLFRHPTQEEQEEMLLFVVDQFGRKQVPLL
jgi:hypothetical protein